MLIFLIVSFSVIFSNFAKNSRIFFITLSFDKKFSKSAISSSVKFSLPSFQSNCILEKSFFISFLSKDIQHHSLFSIKSRIISTHFKKSADFINILIFKQVLVGEKSCVSDQFIFIILKIKIYIFVNIIINIF